MRIVLCLFLAMLTGANCIAQTLGEFKPKDQDYGLNKIKSKRLYIASFTVNYQVYNEKEDFKQGGRMLGGGYKGAAHSSLSVGLENITEAGVESVTDRLYQDFTAQLKASGIEIISANEAGKTETYSDFTKVTGGKINQAQFPGMLASSPTGFEYFVKKVEKSGKEKSGGFLNNPTFVHAKLSKDLNDAMVADIDLFILFVQDKDAWDIAGANIKVKTNMRLAANEAIIMTKNAKIKMKGQNDVVGVNSQAGFYSGKMGAGIVSSYVGTMGKSMGIDGVIDDKKLQAFAKNSADFVGVKTIYGTWYNPANNTSKSTTVIPVDEKKYTDGAYAAGKKFIEYHTGEFLNKLK